MSESKRLSTQELAQTPEYQKLTAKQKLFVLTYVAGGIDCGEYDEVNATWTAYKCKTQENARIMSYAMMQNIRIVAAINRHFNASPTEEFMENLDRAIRNKNLTMAQLGALKLKCDLLGIKTKLPTEHATLTPQIEAVAEDEKVEKKKKKEKPIQPVVPSEVPESLKGFLR
jgi:hypothetical protein